MAKKHKRARQAADAAAPYGAGPAAAYGSGYGAQEAQAWSSAPGAAQPPQADFQTGAGFGGAPAAAGWSPQMPAFLRSNGSGQFLVGAAIGAAAAWVLTDEALRGRIVKGAIRLYAGIAGGVEELKEQMSDLKAEVEAERQGGA